jgi:hypothetical protein
VWTCRRSVSQGEAYVVCSPGTTRCWLAVAPSLVRNRKRTLAGVEPAFSSARLVSKKLFVGPRLCNCWQTSARQERRTDKELSRQVSELPGHVEQEGTCTHGGSIRTGSNDQLSTERHGRSAVLGRARHDRGGRAFFDGNISLGPSSGPRSHRARRVRDGLSRVRPTPAARGCSEAAASPRERCARAQAASQDFIPYPHVGLVGQADDSAPIDWRASQAHGAEGQRRQPRAGRRLEMADL